MDARPFLEEIAEQFQIVGLEAILIGNAGAALQGAPVTTVDFDFFVRETALNLQKIKKFAKNLGGSAGQPFLPASNMIRVSRNDQLQIDFVVNASGIKNFESLRAGSDLVRLDGGTLRVASLGAIIKSKRSAGQPQDLAVLDVLEKTNEIKASQARIQEDT